MYPFSVHSCIQWCLFTTHTYIYHLFCPCFLLSFPIGFHSTLIFSLVSWSTYFSQVHLCAQSTALWSLEGSSLHTQLKIMPFLQNVTDISESTRQNMSESGGAPLASYKSMIDYWTTGSFKQFQLLSNHVSNGCGMAPSSSSSLTFISPFSSVMKPES